MSAAPTAVPWRPIEDLPRDGSARIPGELAALAEVWSYQREALATHGVLTAFSSRLAREFAIETGVIERLYTIDRGVTQLLIERGIDAALIPRLATNLDPELVAALIQDQHESAQQLFDFVKQDRVLSTGYIKELHALLTRHQVTTEAVDPNGRRFDVPLLRGEWKQTKNNPLRLDGRIHEYCPPEHVASEMDRLVEIHHRQLREQLPIEVVAAWLHHRFTQIHPFQDGNGRVARLLASLVFLRANWFLFLVRKSDLDAYLTALEEADAGDLGPFARFCASMQRRELIRSFQRSRDVEIATGASRVIRLAKADIESRSQAEGRGQESVERTAQRLLRLARERLEDISRELAEVLGPVVVGLSAQVEQSTPEQWHVWRTQIRAAAKSLDYFANSAAYHQWLRLVIRNHSETSLLVSFHSFGEAYQGLFAVSACLVIAEGSAVGEVQVLTTEPFLIPFTEETEATSARFVGWLEMALTKGLESWRAGL